jgi:hypothetical protein
VDCIHYVAESVIAREKHFIRESPRKVLAAAMVFFGILLYADIKRKVRQ